ncbi:hypothetical protein [Dendronalium phyllosphericum]|nr:hypothetical protein [Dendronalium phyllosphericum]
MGNWIKDSTVIGRFSSKCINFRVRAIADKLSHFIKLAIDLKS